jgi:hypothetical protein
MKTEIEIEITNEEATTVVLKVVTCLLISAV